MRQCACAPLSCRPVLSFQDQHHGPSGKKTAAPHRFGSTATRPSDPCALAIRHCAPSPRSPPRLVPPPPPRTRPCCPTPSSAAPLPFDRACCDRCRWAAPSCLSPFWTLPPLRPLSSRQPLPQARRRDPPRSCQRASTFPALPTALAHSMNGGVELRMAVRRGGGRRRGGDRQNECECLSVNGAMSLGGVGMGIRWDVRWVPHVLMDDGWSAVAGT